MAINNPIVTDADIIQGIAVAIQEKDHGGKMEFPDMSSRIRALPSIPIEEKDVNFYDYDGTLLYSYTFAEALQLSELPALPTQNGLICQEWNWTLNDIQEQAELEFQCNIGATYTTDNGHTRLYMNVPSNNYLNPSINISISGNCALTIDWGDGTTPDIITSSQTVSHIWNLSIFPIKIMIDLAPSGTGTFGFDCTFNSPNTAMSPYKNMIYRLEIGNKVSVIQTGRLCYGCYNLETITISNSINTFPRGSDFGSCNSLKFIVIPKSINSIPQYCFSGFISFAKISLPNKTFSTIGFYAFQGQRTPIKYLIIPKAALMDTATYGANNISEVFIPKTYLKIQQLAFNGSVALYRIDLSDYNDPNNIPILENTNAFVGGDGTIFQARNQSMLDAFTTATNWSTYANQFEIGGKFAEVI